MDAAGTVITYEVDGLGRRVKRTKSGVSERYLWDGSRIAAVLDNAGAVLRRFVYATSGYVPDAILEGAAGTLYLVVKDERGSVRQLIDPAGAVAEKYDYDEWGKELSGPTPRKSLFGFAGGVYDPDTGLVRFGARDYDPVVGRWTTKDSVRFRGGWNLYGYCNADPINCVDPTGFDGNEYEWWLSQEGNTPGKGIAWGLAGVGAIVGGLLAAPELAALGATARAGLTGLAGAAGGTCGDSAQKAMARAKDACPGGNCLQLSDKMIAELGGQGKLLQVVPMGRGALPTAPGLAGPGGWGHHVVVQLPGGAVADPLVGTTYPSLEAFLAATFTGPVRILP